MQTTEFKTSKKINIKNVHGEYHWLIMPKLHKEPFFSHILITNQLKKEGKEITELYSAYTLDEILEMLPTEIKGYYPYYLSLIKGQKGWMIEYLYKPDEHKITGHELLVCKHNKNPAEAAGQLLVWCIEQGYIKAEDLNNE